LSRYVPDLIRDRLIVLKIRGQFLEVQAQHAFIRDESSKGRWDAALTRSLFSFMMEVFERTVGRDLGPHDGAVKAVEHVC
jgi:carboxymethylenebutenolidase